MDRLRHLPCPRNLLEVCEAPFEDEHHIRPRRLLGMAAAEGCSADYQAKLKKVVNHPLNRVLVCRCIHKFAFDGATEDVLPVEPELDNLLGRWDG